VTDMTFIELKTRSFLQEMRKGTFSIAQRASGLSRACRVIIVPTNA
jgi:hypothetical protein